MKVLPLLQGELMELFIIMDRRLNGTPVFYFRQVPLISEGKIVEIVEVLDV